MCSKTRTPPSTAPSWANLDRLREALDRADAVVIGAGSGLSAAAGFDYTGARFRAYFADFEAQYGFHDMYTGGFFPFRDRGEFWAYWSRYIWINRYQDPPRPVYRDLLALAEGKDHFVLTTNVDHCFQRAGFDKKRLFYTQGDYGLWQCSRPCHRRTYDNEETVRQMLAAQGFRLTGRGLDPPVDGTPDRSVPAGLVPRCPVCGAPMVPNLRADDTFVQDEGWYAAAGRYEDFLRRHRAGRVLYWELGVGYNTPAIIKYPFWKMTAQNPHARYACVNRDSDACPPELGERAIPVRGDLGTVLRALLHT